MNKKIINVLIVLTALSLSGCAKRALMKFAEPEAVKECEDNFYRQFRALVSNKEERELKNIKTLSECREFQDKFWHIRDTDPTTPQNEYKEEKEKLAKDIKNDALFQHEGTRGFSFKGNGDFWGDAGKVYMLHGMPAFTETLQNGRTYVDLMLWVYPDEKGNHKYRFLFYKKNDVGNFVLLRQNFDIFYGLQEINKTPTITHPLDVYYELEREAKYIFLYSLVEFSDDLSMNIDKALRPPRPASEIAKELAPKIIGGTQDKKEKLFYKSKFQSTIPAKFYTFFNENSFGYGVEVSCENLDFTKNEDGILESKLVLKVIIQNLENPDDILTNNTEIPITINTVEEIKKNIRFGSTFLQNHSSSRYKISAFLQNTLTNKYNAWVEEIKK